jgi:hypothetical protein
MAHTDMPEYFALVRWLERLAANGVPSEQQ